LDHSGKSTLIKSIAKELQKRKTEFILTREPGGTKLGETIREIVLNPYNDTISPETEILLISASRRDHIEKVILPTLKEGKWVICDRFWPSTSAFQGAGRNLAMDRVNWINQFTVPQDLTPDLWVLLDMPVSEKEKRSYTKGHSSDRFEIQNRDFHQRVREHYLKLAKENNNWFLLNALLSPEELSHLVIKELENRKWLS